MVVPLSLLLGLILLFLGLLHIYWAAGGTWALASAMPPEMREKVAQPEQQTGFRVLTVLVALGLIFSGAVALSYLTGGIPDGILPYRRWFAMALAGLFLVRAIGDFNQVGLFSRQHGDLFFVRDRTVYSPLCLLVAGLWGGLILLA
ncbi:DUF3995 domain-containing protein [Neolewinella aurantiaca]|uniref:DUF3995 domain-containing protein n=1 Tax=Neolewinella aurantiaca TaxID=2602767 RepID=A0A5C7FCQ6_9BACT|nr:DUF3995 domain-containing protein [Neolewinella aurantiaca]TXF87871.1 DUF3995 domain-containing protein [Neolewinella aurantiaca]